MTGKTDYRYFVGLPSPAGALTLAAIIYYAPAPVNDHRFAIVIMILTAARRSRWSRRSAGGAEGHQLPEGALADVHRRDRRDPGHRLGLAAPVPLFFAIGYLASGPLIRLWTIVFPPPRDPGR